jgi:hypothetical protein
MPCYIIDRRDYSVRKELFVFLIAIILLVTLGCNSEANYIEINNDSISYNGITYIPLSHPNYSHNSDAQMTKVGWTYNFYASKVDVFVFVEDVQHNFLYIEGMDDSLWISDVYLLKSIYEIEIYKFVAWIPNPDNFEILRTTIWESKTNLVLLEEIININGKILDSSTNFSFYITIYTSDYPFLIITNINIYKSAEEFYIVGLEDGVDEYYQIDPYYYSAFENSRLNLYGQNN